MSIYALLAAKEALAQAGLDEKALPRMGVCMGSTMGRTGTKWVASASFST